MLVIFFLYVMKSVVVVVVVFVMYDIVNDFAKYTAITAIAFRSFMVVRVSKNVVMLFGILFLKKLYIFMVNVMFVVIGIV